MARTAEVIPGAKKGEKDLPRLKAANRGQKPVAQPMNSEQILRHTMSKQVPPDQLEKLMQSLAAMAKMGKAKFLQVGNTVFLLINKGNGTFEFHTATVEPPDVLVERFKAGAKAAKQIGATKLVSYFQDPSFQRIAQMTGLPVKISMSQQVSKTGAQPAYMAEITL